MSTSARITEGAAKLRQLLDRKLRMRVCCGTHGKRNQKLIRMQAGISGAQILGLQPLDRHDRFRGNQLFLVRNACIFL